MGYSVEELAEELSAHWATNYRYERGEVAVPPTKVKLMKLLSKTRQGAA